MDLLRRTRRTEAGDAPRVRQSPRIHLEAATDWLERCHDMSRDGGLPGRYRLHGGWSRSYPETTGYAIPTFLRLADHLARPYLKGRAERCAAFLLAQRTDLGAFPGGEVGSGSDASVFNTAQILHGLDAWSEAADVPAAREAAIRAAEWLVRVQHEDGAWRDFTYGGLACAYYAHASCWLGRFGARLDEPRWVDAAKRNVAWVLGRQQENGWFDTAGFPRDHARRIAETHTIGYTLWGLLVSSEALKLPEARAAAERAAGPIADYVLEHGWLPGRLDHAWQSRADYACLTGNAQLAQVWSRLARDGGDPRFGRAAKLALQRVLEVHPIEASEREIRGGVPGSSPIWGDYLPNELPNWSAKFLADALVDVEG